MSGTIIFIGLSIIIVFLLWYIISFRGVNNKKAAFIEQQTKLKLGDNVILSNGIHGKVNKITKSTVDVLIDKSKGVTITIERYCIAKIIGN